MSTQNRPEYITIIEPDGKISYERNLYYDQPTVIRRTYSRPPKPKYRYTIEQEGKTYRCCQWCRYWCTRKCSLCSCCDRIFSCPLVCFILSLLFLLALLAAILTLFALHPNINSARRYYGIISTLSIVNRTKYIYGADTLCTAAATSPANCMNLVTSTGLSYLDTTIVLNETVSMYNCFYSSFVFVCFSLIISINLIKNI